MKIGLFGTFDIGNFGDVLFPLVAQAMLQRARPGTQLELYSYRPKSSANWYYDVLPIQSLPERLGSLDLVLVGGGHLLHGNRYMAAGYGPTDPSIPHPFGFWWLPVMAAAMARVPSALHGVSIDPGFPGWCEPMLKAFAETVDYPSVRDTASQARLSGWAPSRDVTMIPDSIFSISRLIERGKLSPQCAAYFSEHGLHEKPYLIVQPSAALRAYMPFMDRLIDLALARGWAVLELPIFAEAHNRVGVFASRPGVISATHWPEPMLLAEIIANSAAVAGISLHLSIVASTYGIPVFRPRYARGSKYILLDGLSNISFMDDGSADLRDAANAYTPDRRIGQWQASLDQHYDRLIALAMEGSQRIERHVRGWDMLRDIPDSFRQRRAFGERLADVKLHARRSRHFLMAQAMPAMRWVRSAIRSRKR